MIFKADLIDAINDTNHDLALLAVKLSDLEKKVEKIEKRVCKCDKACPKKCEKKVADKPVKRGRGRPRKNQ